MSDCRRCCQKSDSSEDSEIKKNEKDELYNASVNLLIKFGELLENEDNFDIPHKSSEKSVKARLSGNEFFKSSKHDKLIHAKILWLYNKCIAYANENSEELALGYGNRSALLIHLKKYKECLVDINRAYEITKSDELKRKLIARKHDCLVQLNGIKEDVQKTPPLDYKPSKNNPCASDLVTIQYNEKYGRHVVAAQDIQPGTIIAIDKSFLLYPPLETLPIHCYHCLSMNWNGIPCPSCTVAIYCSEKCKEEAWQQYHDIECQVLTYIDYLKKYCSVVEFYALPVKLFIKIIKSEGLANILKEADEIDKNKDKPLSGFFHNELFQCHKFRFIYNLSENEQHPEYSHSMCKMIIRLLDQKTKIFHEAKEGTTLEAISENTLINVLKIFEKLQRITANNAAAVSTLSGRSNKESVTYGGFFGSFFHLFNHSCLKNTGFFFTKNQEACFYTYNYIRKGEQLCICTVPPQNADNRHEYLKNYNIFCDCQACEGNWPLPPSAPQASEEVDYPRMFSDLERNDLSEIFKLVFYNQDELVFSKDTLKKVVKIINIMYKYHNSYQAFNHTYKFKDYITDYYENFYGIRDDIPPNC